MNEASTSSRLHEKFVFTKQFIALAAKHIFLIIWWCRHNLPNLRYSIDIYSTWTFHVIDRHPCKNIGQCVVFRPRSRQSQPQQRTRHEPWMRHWNVNFKDENNWNWSAKTIFAERKTNAKALAGISIEHDGNLEGDETENIQSILWHSPAAATSIIVNRRLYDSRDRRLAGSTEAISGNST